MIQLVVSMIIYLSKTMDTKLKDFVDVQAMNMPSFQGQGSPNSIVQAPTPG